MMGWYLSVVLWMPWGDPSVAEVRVEPGASVEAAGVATYAAPLVLTWSPEGGFGTAIRVEVELDGGQRGQ